jgi:hypothetical protein
MSILKDIRKIHFISFDCHLKNVIYMYINSPVSTYVPKQPFDTTTNSLISNHTQHSVPCKFYSYSAV